ncbi:MAG: LIC_13387 family protein [Terracidiphilus sp.]
MRKPVLFLRIASVLTLIHSILHTVGGVFGKIDPGPASIAAEAMKVNHFLFMGSLRSYWEFHRGMGLMVTIFLTAEAVIFWQLSSLAKSGSRRLRPILATFVIAYAAMAVNSVSYFFLVPVIMESVVAVLLGLAIVTAEPEAAGTAGGPK